MEKKVLGVLVLCTFLSFLFPVIARFTIPIMLVCIGLLTLFGFWTFIKIFLITSPKEKPHGNQTSR